MPFSSAVTLCRKMSGSLYRHQNDFRTGETTFAADLHASTSRARLLSFLETTGGNQSALEREAKKERDAGERSSPNTDARPSQLSRSRRRTEFRVQSRADAVAGVFSLPFPLLDRDGDGVHLQIAVLVAAHAEGGVLARYTQSQRVRASISSCSSTGRILPARASRECEDSTVFQFFFIY